MGKIKVGVLICLFVSLGVLSADIASAKGGKPAKKTQTLAAVIDAPTEAMFGQRIRLDARRSSNGIPGKITRYLWTSLDCVTNRVSPGTPTETNIALLEITVTHAPSLCRFQLIVIDALGSRSQPTIVEIAIKDTQHPTAVIEAPSEAKLSQGFTLDAKRSSDVFPGTIARYLWTSLDCRANRMAPGIPLETGTPTLEVAVTTAPNLCRFQLIVIDNSGNHSTPVSVNVVVRDTQTPTAVIGTQPEVRLGQNIIMDGRRSSDVAPGKIVKYLWTSLDCATDQLIPGIPHEVSASTIEVKVTSAGRCTFELVVVDDSGNRSLPDRFPVLVQDNKKPTAVLHVPPQIELGRSFILDGRHSSDIAPGKIVTYLWTSLDCPTDKLIPGTPLSTPTPTIEVTGTTIGRCRFELIAENGTQIRSLPDRVDVIIHDTKNPTAVLDAPPQVELGRNFMLDGRRSSDVAPGKIVKYLWTSLDCGTNRLLPGIPLDGNTPTIEIKGSAAGRCAFELSVVSDTGTRSLADRVDVVIRDTQNPTAVMEIPPQVELGRSFILDGRRSSDVAPGKIVKYLWTSLNCNADRINPGASLEVNTSTIEIKATSAGRCAFELSVVDNSGQRSLPDRVHMIVRDTQHPTAVLDIPPQVELGRIFTLNGRRSSDVAPGKIVKYLWTSLNCGTDRLIPGTPLETNDPTLELKGVSTGRCTFELSVENDAGARSLPDRVDLIIRDIQNLHNALIGLMSGRRALSHRLI